MCLFFASLPPQFACLLHHGSCLLWVDTDGGSTPAAEHDIVPVGSYAKPWTAVAILHLVEQGLFALEDLAAPLIDPFLKRTNGTTMQKLFGNEVLTLTVRDLLHMRSGFDTYGDTYIHNITVSDPEWDITPNDYIALQKQHTLMHVSCACPGTPCDEHIKGSPTAYGSPACCNGTRGDVRCPVYNSMNYLYLGMLYSKSQITCITSLPYFKIVQHLDLRCALLLDPRTKRYQKVLGGKIHLESSIKKF